MSSARSERLLGSTSFRLSAAYAGLLVLAFAAAGVGAWLTTKSVAEREVHQRVELEMKALQAEIRAESLDAAIAAIKSRSESPGALEYRLADAGGRVLVGSLVVDRPAPGWRVIQVDDSHGGTPDIEEFLTLTAATPNGSILTIGDDLDKAERVRKAVMTALLDVAAATLLVVFAAGILLARASVRRMKRLSDALSRVGQGDFSARAPERGSDEIARIGQGVNVMLGQIDRLVINIRRVSTDVAHDLRTPLAHVRQQLEAAAQSDDVAIARDGIRAAQARIDDVLRVFQAILRLTEIDSGGARSRFTRVDLAGIVERVTDAYRGDIEAAGRGLRVETLGETSVQGDADLIAQALANLLENAMRHTPPGSPIDVKLSHAGGVTVFAVVDHGPGIPERDRKRVLEPFVRLDASRTTEGAGLGLSIVSSIARLHGAALRFEDAVPGFSATIEWPADAAERQK